MDKGDRLDGERGGEERRVHNRREGDGKLATTRSANDRLIRTGVTSDCWQSEQQQHAAIRTLVDGRLRYLLVHLTPDQFCQEFRETRTPFSEMWSSQPSSSSLLSPPPPPPTCL